MTKDETVRHLAQALVRHGERIELAVMDWLARLHKTEDGTPDSIELHSRIATAKTFVRHLREDIESGIPLDAVYTLAADDLPEDSPDFEFSENEQQQLARRLRAAVREAEKQRIRADQLEAAIDAHQELTHLRSDKAREHQN